MSLSLEFRPGTISRTLSALTIALSLAGGGATHADERAVTVLGISGEHGADIAYRLESALASRYFLVESAVYRLEAEAIHKTGASPEEVSAVTWRLRIDAVVAGKVLVAGAKRALHVNVRDGGTGEIIGRYDERLGRGGTLSAAGELRVMNALVKLVDQAQGAPRWKRPNAATDEPVNDAPVVAQSRRRAQPLPPERDDDDSDAPPGMDRPPARGPSGEDELPPPRRRLPRAAEERTDDGEAPSEGVVVRRRAPGFRAVEGIAVDAGFGLLRRSLDFDAAGATPYHGGLVPAVRVDASAFPVAWNSSLARAHPVLACFGVAIQAVVALPFTSQGLTSDLAGGSARRWDASLVARIPLRARGDFALRLAGGYGQIAYSSDDPARLGVPDVDYRLLRQSIGFTFPLGTPRVTLDVGGAIFAVLDTGAIGTLSEYGDGSAWGGDAEATFTVRPARWLYLAAAAHYTSVNLSFHGGGARLGTGAHDQLFDGGLVIGYAVR